MGRAKIIDEQVLNVSRSFAFVIDRLPEPLRGEVQVAYLLFRLGDNIEDTSSLGIGEKQYLLDKLLHCFRTGTPSPMSWRSTTSAVGRHSPRASGASSATPTWSSRRLPG